MDTHSNDATHAQHGSAARFAETDSGHTMAAAAAVPEVSFLSASTASDTSSGASKRGPTAMMADAAVPPRHFGGARSASPAGLPMPLLRAVHRRVRIPVGEVQATIDALVDQSNADHDYLAELRDAVITAHQQFGQLQVRFSAVEKENKNWQKWHADNARKLLEMEGKITVGNNEAKNYAHQRVAEIERGLVDTQLVQRVQRIEAMLPAQEGYIKALYDKQPEDGMSISKAFQWLENEVALIKGNVPRKEDMASTFSLMGGSLDAIRAEAQKQAAELQKHEMDLGNVHKTLFNMNSELANVQSMTMAAGPADNVPEAPAAGIGYARGTGRNRGPQFANAYSHHGHTHVPGETCGFDGLKGRGSGGSPSRRQEPPNDNFGPPGFSSTHNPYGNNGGQAVGMKGQPGPCHCEHVDRLVDQMRDAQREMTRMSADVGSVQREMARMSATDRTPFIPGAEAHRARAGVHDPAERDPPGAGPVRLPLDIAPGTLGSLTTGRIFDDKVPFQSEFQFDGSKKSNLWKYKTRRYIMSQVAASGKILDWAEREDQTISDHRLRQVSQPFSSPQFGDSSVIVSLGTRWSSSSKPPI